MGAAVSGFDQHLYRQRVPLFWWLSRRTYLAFVVRELTSVFVAWFVVYLLLLVRALAAGADRYASFLDWAARPWLIALNVVALAFTIYHTVTWFAVTPQAVAVKVRGRRLPGRALAGTLYLAWLAVSALILWLVLA
ncbi:fumarate reductase subunit C [Actinomycetes bacterium KLBMP 9797]